MVFFKVFYGVFFKKRVFKGFKGALKKPIIPPTTPTPRMLFQKTVACPHCPRGAGPHGCLGAAAAWIVARGAGGVLGPRGCASAARPNRKSEPLWQGEVDPPHPLHPVGDVFWHLGRRRNVWSATMGDRLTGFSVHSPPPSTAVAALQTIFSPCTEFSLCSFCRQLNEKGCCLMFLRRF